MSNKPYSFVTLRTTVNTFITISDLKYLLIHAGMSSLYPNSALIEHFSYNKPGFLLKSNFRLKSESGFRRFRKAKANILSYNLSSIMSILKFNIFSGLQVGKPVDSISDVFPSGNWLERESSEMLNIFYKFKKDCRNLLLMYGDSTAPLFKYQPSTGLIEVVFNNLTGMVNSFSNSNITQ